MGRIIFSALCTCLFLLQSAFAQDYRSDVCTPKGDPIAAWVIQNEFIDSLKQYWDGVYTRSYPHIKILKTNGNYSTTMKFNCHSYAWHISDGGSNRWIGYYIGNTDEYDYWLKGSYIEVGLQQYPGKVSYSSDDHSAITTMQQGKFISKWGNKILAEHGWNDCPYNSSNLKYYKLNFSINGEAIVCINGGVVLYSLTNIPGGLITWSKSPNLIINGSNTSQSLSITASSAGNGYIGVSFTSGCGTTLIVPSKSVWVGPPINSQISAMVMQGPPAGNQLCLNSYMTIAAGHSAIAAQGVTSYSWGFGNWSPYFQEYSLAPGPLQARPVFYLPTGAPSSQVLTISAQNGCYPNTAPPFQKTFYAITCGYSLVFSPNPANDNTEVILTNTDETDIVAYTVKVTNNSGQTLSVDKKSGKRFTLPTSSLKDGLYIVEVVKGNEVYRENLVVKH